MIGRPTRQGGTAPLFVVDAGFADAVSRHAWFSDKRGYIRARTDAGPTLLHRFVWHLQHGSAPPLLDHINCVKWDCRIENLRPATATLNSLNATQRKRKHHHLPRGVAWVPSKPSPYIARIRLDGKSKHLGAFPTPEQASAAYEKARAEAIANAGRRSQ